MPTFAGLSIEYACATVFPKKKVRGLAEPCYMKVFRHLDTFESHGFTLDISHLHLDFEVANITACHFWPDVISKACRFHFASRLVENDPSTWIVCCLQDYTWMKGSYFWFMFFFFFGKLKKSKRVLCLI